MVTPQEMARVDELTRTGLRISSFELMKRVSEEIARRLRRDFPKASSVLVLTGPGNNGGDGYCVAEFLQAQNVNVSVFSIVEPQSSDCVEARHFFRGVMTESLPSRVDLLIDAIFGNQSRADFDADLSQKLIEIDQIQANVRVALDLPTGVNGETGAAHPLSFRADETYTIAYPKLGQLHESLMERAGAFRLVAEWFEKPEGSARAFWIEPQDFSFTDRSPTSHKGSFGRCGVVAGSAKTPGAALLSAEAAHRVGAGYVHLFFADHSLPTLDLEKASFLFEDSWTLKSLEKCTSLVVGSGGLPSEWREILALPMPMVLDAEVLNALGAEGGPRKLRENQLLTPHWGEAKRLARNPKISDRREMLEHLVDVYGAPVYLKGAPGLLKFPDRPEIFSNLHVNPGFAKAGSGDVLSGILGGCLAQSGRGDFPKAIVSGLAFHAALGEVIRSSRGIIASDHLKSFSEAFELLRSAV